MLSKQNPRKFAAPENVTPGAIVPLPVATLNAPLQRNRNELVPTRCMGPQHRSADGNRSLEVMRGKTYKFVTEYFLNRTVELVTREIEKTRTKSFVVGVAVV